MEAVVFYERNLGLISQEQQEKLVSSNVLVAGCGGMGGVCAEVLVRMGVGAITLADHDYFEESNFNRQIHSNQETLNKNKAEVLAEQFLKINPELKIKVFNQGITISNINTVLEGVDVIVNGMDQLSASLILERTARKKNLTIVDAWITPYASVFVMTPNSPHWEDFLGLPTKNIEIDQITDELIELAIQKEAQFTLSKGQPFNYVKKEDVEKIIKKEMARPSLAPVVWLSGTLMANEVFKIIVGYQCLDHKGIFYDQYQHKFL